LKSRPIRAVKTCRVAVIREDIAAHRDELVALCRDYGVRRLEILGSGARGADFDEVTSDADFLVKFDGDGGGSPLRKYLGFARARLCSVISAHFFRRPRVVGQFE
jgi:predicted nucleotidyltransferase